MSKYLFTILMMACAIMFTFSSCKEGNMEGNDTSQDTYIHSDGPVGDSIIENAVTDVDSNTYSAVKLGNQVWMAENLRTTRYADKTPIPLGNNASSVSVGYRYYPGNNPNNVSEFGYLYNWKAVMNTSRSSALNPSRVQGICPDGWHVPSSAEWAQLTNYVSSQSQYVCGSDKRNITKALASTERWCECSDPYTPGNDPSSNNATGFSALPSGGTGFFSFIGYETFFWSCTANSARPDHQAYYRFFLFESTEVTTTYGHQMNGFSVRCVRN